MTGTRRFFRFNVVSAAGFIVQLLTVALLTRWLGIPGVVATGMAVVAAVVHNFLWHRRWTWVDRAGGPSGVATTFVRFATANGAVSIAGNVLVVAVLIHATDIGVVAANVVAVGLCGLLNYLISDRVVFRGGNTESV